MSMLVLMSSPAARKPMQLNVPILSSSCALSPHCLKHKIYSRAFTLQSRKAWRHSVVSVLLDTKPVIKNGVLSYNGNNALFGIPDNVVVTPWSNSSFFLGATFTKSTCRHVFKLGLIE